MRASSLATRLGAGSVILLNTALLSDFDSSETYLFAVERNSRGDVVAPGALTPPQPPLISDYSESLVQLFQNLLPTTQQVSKLPRIAASGVGREYFDVLTVPILMPNQRTLSGRGSASCHAS